VVLPLGCPKNVTHLIGMHTSNSDQFPKDVISIQNAKPASTLTG